MKIRGLHVLLLSLGLIGLAWMLHSVGPGVVWRGLRSLGWGLWALILLEGLGETLHTEAWRHCLSGPARSRPFRQLFWIRMAGSGVNYFTPTAALGGEFIRGSLVAFPGGAVMAASAVLIDKACMALAHLLLVIVGAILLLGTVPLPAALKTAMLVSGSLLAAGIVTFMLLQKRGQLGAVLRWLTARRLGGARLKTFSEQAALVDEACRAFYRDRSPDLGWCILGHLAGIAVGMVQPWLFFLLLHQPASFPTLAAVWVLGLWSDLLVFMVPMSLGTLEGSRMAIFVILGYPAAQGVTYGFASRLMLISWAAAGLVSYGALAFWRPTARVGRLAPRPE